MRTRERASKGGGGFIWARKSSPRGPVSSRKREKVRPARSKHPKFGVFVRAGRDFSRKGRWRAVLGELCRADWHCARVSEAERLPPCLQWWGFCTTRGLLVACRRRVGPSCSAIPPAAQCRIRFCVHTGFPSCVDGCAHLLAVLQECHRFAGVFAAYPASFVAPDTRRNPGRRRVDHLHHHTPMTVSDHPTTRAANQLVARLNIEHQSLWGASHAHQMEALQVNEQITPTTTIKRLRATAGRVRHRPRSLKTAGVEVRSSSRTSTSTRNPRPTPGHPYSTRKSQFAFERTQRFSVIDMLEERLEQALRLAIDPPGGLNTAALRDLIRDGENTQWDIATTAEYLGISAHTLRYYERAELVKVGRDASGYRLYDAAAVRRLVFITRMRVSGMSIAQLQHYISLVEQGAETVQERLDLMLEHRDILRQRIEDLQLSLAATEFKIAMYQKGSHP